MLRLWQAIPLSIALGVLSLWLVLPNLSLEDISTALGDLDPRLGSVEIQSSAISC